MYLCSNEKRYRFLVWRMLGAHWRADVIFEVGLMLALVSFGPFGSPDDTAFRMARHPAGGGLGDCREIAVGAGG